MAEVALATDAARLTDLSRAVKAAARSVTLYPEGHPSIAATLGRVTQLTSPPVLTAPLRIGVSADNLLIDGLPIGKPDTAVSELAVLLHSHLVGELTVAPGGSVAGWRQFLLLLGRAHDDIRAEGGIARVWTATGHRHLELREIDYAEVLRERWNGVAATWQRVVTNCLTGDGADIPEELVASLLDGVSGSEALAEVVTSVETVETGATTLTSRSDALVRLLNAISKALAAQSPERVEPVMRDLSGSLGRLSPDMLLALVKRVRKKGRLPDPAAPVVETLVDRMTDTTIAGFVARNASGLDAPVERVVQAFQSLVWEAPRRERLVSLAREQAMESEGEDPTFEGRWSGVAEKLLTRYDDESYVSASYAHELTNARLQAVQIEQLNEDPPEQISAWLGTVSTTELRKLDLALVLDLLRLEQEPAQREALAQPVLTILRDLVMVGDFDTALEVMAGVRSNRAADSDEPTEFERSVTARFATASTSRHLVGHLSTSDEPHFERLKHWCHTFGDGLVRPLTEALAGEERTRIRERLTEILVDFGPVALPQIEHLKDSSDQALRRTALYLLREFGVSDRLPDLKELTSSRDLEARTNAVHAIVRNGTNRAYHLFVQALTTATPAARDAIMQALAGLNDERAAPLLVHILEHVDYASDLEPMYARALDQAGRLRSPIAVPVLETVLQRGEWWAPRRTAAHREAAAAALANIGTPEALDALAAASRRGSRGSRRAAQAHLSATSRTAHMEHRV